MDNLTEKIDKHYLFALLIVAIVYVSFELFKFGFALGSEQALLDASLK